MIVKLLTEHNLEFLSLKEAAEARPSLHLPKCQIVGNLIPRLSIIVFQFSSSFTLTILFPFLPDMIKVSVTQIFLNH